MKTKEDLQLTFGVSSATIQNWIKTKLIPSPSVSGAYSESAFEEIKAIIDGHDSKLKFRANRKRNDARYIHKDTIDNKASLPLVERIVFIHRSSGSDITTTILALATVLLERRSLINYSNFVVKVNYQGAASQLFQEFINKWFLEANTAIFYDVHRLVADEVMDDDELDFLGTVYQSLRTTSEKSENGAFFTPSHLLNDIKALPHESIIDPCCGSGRMLLNCISKEHNTALIYARDTDELALKICRVNLVLFFNSTNITPQVEFKDFIFESSDKSELFSYQEQELKFDIVVSNPPWGAKFSTEEKKNLINRYPLLKTSESFSVCLYNAINLLKSTGKLYFILPESILSVDTHYTIRKYFITHTKYQIITRFGNAFKNVVSKVIRLDIFRQHDFASGLYLVSDGEKVAIPLSILRNDTLQIPIVNNSHEIQILEQIFKHKYTSLQGQCTFGLGIVTGDNAAHLLNTPAKDSEPVFKGKDIEPFLMNNANSHIVFKPESLQQVAPIHLYRSKKICYRFISDKVIMAVDEKGSLLLNSANFFIPKIDLPFEVIVTLFNSSVITFFYQRVFNSFKLLRNHIEDFPIPCLTAEQISTLLKLYKGSKAQQIDIEIIDRYVGSLYGLDEAQIQYISQNVRKHG